MADLKSKEDPPPCKSLPPNEAKVPEDQIKKPLPRPLIASDDNHSKVLTEDATVCIKTLPTSTDPVDQNMDSLKEGNHQKTEEVEVCKCNIQSVPIRMTP